MKVASLKEKGDKVYVNEQVATKSNLGDSPQGIT